MPPSARCAVPTTRAAPSASPPSPPTCSRRSTRQKAAELAAALRKVGAPGRPAPVAAAAAAQAVIALRADAEPLAIWFADAALAKSLNWPFAVPLLAGELFGVAPRARDGGRARARPAGSSSRRSLRARGARRPRPGAGPVAARGPAHGRRAKTARQGEGRARQALLDDDAVSAAAPIAGLATAPAAACSSAWSRLGAARELTGRATFRLYGL